MSTAASPVVVPSTRYGSFSRGRALAVVAVFSAVVALCLWNSRSEAPTGSDRENSDVALYEHVIARLQAGQPYYDALGTEARQRGFRTNSVFNWRTPLLLEVLAHLPNTSWACGLLGGGAACALALALLVILRSGRGIALALVQGVAMGAALVLTVMTSAILFGDVWAGVLIAISIGAYGVAWNRSGAVAGILALFFRELAAPYALICVVFAWRHRRRQELAVWLCGLAIYGAYFGLHAYRVLAQVPPGTVAQMPALWIRFGGLPVLLMMSRAGLLLALPLHAAAVYLPLAVLGLIGWSGQFGERLLATVATYLVLFSVVGFPMNFYWGAIYSPLLAYGVTWALPSCRDLARAVWRAPAAPAPTSGGEQESEGK